MQNQKSSSASQNKEEAKENTVPNPDEASSETEEIESKKFAFLHEDTSEIMDCTETEIATNELEYLLADQTWKELLTETTAADKMINRLVELGFAKPSKIQSKIIPLALTKRSVGILAQSHNGSGKTLSFAIPAVLRVDLSKPLINSKAGYYPQIVILAPNIELCTQTVKVIEMIAAPFPDIKVSGGDSPAHIIVRTPKKILTLLSNKAIDFSGLEFLVVDEGDTQLSGDSETNLLQLVEKLPRGAGLFFFSATYTNESLDYINAFFKKIGTKSIFKYMLKAEELNLKGIYQFSKRCDERTRKADYIDKLLANLETDMQILIFANTKRFTYMIFNQLQSKGHSVAYLVSGLQPQERTEIFNSFKQGKYKILITTNLLARGFDQRTIGLVINVDIPRHYGENIRKADCETYLHRIGRTGRFGDVGLVLNLFSTDEEKALIDEIEKHYSIQIKDLSKVEDDKAFDMVNKHLEEVVKINIQKHELQNERIQNYPKAR